MNSAVPLATLIATYNRMRHRAEYQGKTQLVALYDQKIADAIEADRQKKISETA
jgi:hypothetical protein